MTTATDTWRVRGEDGTGDGREVGLALLSQGLGDGLWSEADQVRGPHDPGWILIGNHPGLQEFLPAKPMFSSKEGEEAEMDMTPMIDVTFQLIIFFMITATFVVQKTLDMPEATAEQEADSGGLPTLSQLAVENVIVTVNADGSIEVDSRPVTIEELPAALVEASKKNPDNVEMIMDVHDDVSYDVVVQVIDGAAGAKMAKVHFVSRGPPGSSS